MSSITIHSIDEELDLRLTKEAKKLKTSKNKLIKELLARSMGMANTQGFSDDYREFCNLWTQEERQAFDTWQSENAQIDEGDW